MDLGGQAYISHFRKCAGQGSGEAPGGGGPRKHCPGQASSPAFTPVSSEPQKVTHLVSFLLLPLTSKKGSKDTQVAHCLPFIYFFLTDHLFNYLLYYFIIVIFGRWEVIQFYYLFLDGALEVELRALCMLLSSCSTT